MEEIRPATTPAEMRAEIERQRLYDPATRDVMAIADRDGLSPEDRYTYLAYLLLRAVRTMQEEMLEIHKRVSQIRMPQTSDPE